MVGWVYAPFALCAALALCAPLCRRLPPGPGAWMVVVGAVSGAVGTVWALVLLAASLVDDIPGVDGEGPFGLPVNDQISVAALFLLAWCGVRVAWELRMQLQLRRRLRGLQALGGPDLVVLPDATARAFVVPGRPGRVVVTDSMLRALTTAERRVLFAHERTHLRARHPAALGLAHLAVAANPVLIPAARTAAFLIERHADETAAIHVDDRLLVADALAAAALASTGSGGSVGVTPSFEGVSVVDRITALQVDPRLGHRYFLAPIAAAIAVVVGAALYSTLDFAALVHRLFEH